MNPYASLNLQKLSIRFPGTPEIVALQDLSLSLGKGKTLAIVGESGSGKSMTALALMGLLPPNAIWQGNIKFQTEEETISLTEESAKQQWQQVRGRLASMVFQDPMTALNPVMKIGQQLSETVKVRHKISPKKAKVIALEWMEKVKLPTPEKSYHRYPHQLSGGQKQRVVIAMAMSCHPTVLLADEPTTALDVTVQKEILQLMKTLQEEMGMAMIFITHDLALASELADDVLVLYKGAVMEYGAANKVLLNPQNNYTKALLSCRPDADSKGKRLPIVADFLEGNAVPVMPLNHKIDISKEPLLKVRNLRVWFPSEKNFFGTPTHFLRAVEDVSFNLFEGEILGLVGESGCGKSTISRALMGLQKPESGNMYFERKDLAHLSVAEWRKLRREVQMIFQDPYSSLNPRLNIGQMLMEPLIVHRIVRNKDAPREAARLLDLVQLPSSAMHRYPHEFSGGQRQRIGIARALALRPKLILCDESVSALDISVQAQILNLLKDLQQEFRLSYLFISHDLNVVHYIADQVLVMQHGKVVERGTAEEVLRHPTQPYTKKLVAAIP